MSNPDGILRPHHGKLVLFQRVSDAAWIGLVHLLLIFLYDAGIWGDHSAVLTGGAVLAFLFAAEAGGLYRGWRGVPLHKELVRVWLSWGAVVTVALFAMFALKASSSFSRTVMVGWFIGAPLVISAWRAAVRGFLREARKRGRNTRRVAIAGVTEMGVKVAHQLLATPVYGMQLAGFFDDRKPERLPPLTGVGELTGSFADLFARSRAGEIDVVYLALPLRAEPRINRLLSQLADTTASVYIVPDFFTTELIHGKWSSLDDMPLVSVFETPFWGIDGWVKRLEDIVLGGVFLAIAAVPMILIGIVIKLTSRGPVFFRQRRYGLNGDVIEVLKFRTMTVAEDGTDVRQATKNDSRITSFGGFLRRSSLDELPQLIHVVTGAMSLVGPRPHAVAHNEAYRTRIHGYMLRHKVKPGLTGWAQVNGWRGETDTLEKMEKRVEHDLEYIRRWGLILDLKIILLTIFSPKVHRNAY